ncbi:ABC transporter permease [Sphaerochaeta globosa]|uniref:ABC-type transporter, integral membrane subunit n=1 Tax=Sphaerochaeta globosa (strain ATCC BAA-1886 / DSM 22777 / Buddy) TaxID=158189 RepID=F0RSC7_SPHGB|nr:ABC transporter permease [Sphaerochaeta globosa]ADY14327.1 ABC-type transporter, integral membrane subunit [Sphaerochaeta globosa str. Buddy]
MKTPRLLRNKIAMAGLVLILLYVLMSVVSLFWLPFDPLAMHAEQILQQPSFATGHLFGTDEFGRDILSRIMKGTSVSFIISVSATALGAVIGIFMGVWAGYLGGKADNVIMRIADILFSFPSLLLAIFIMAVLGEHTYNVVLAIGIVYIPQFARISRGAIIALKGNEFIRAAKSNGAGRNYILAHHLLPNITAPLIVQISLSLSTAILLESALSFLGLGVQPPNPSWGNMLSSARKVMMFAPWTAVYPGLAIVLLVLGFNLLGDGLRDILDPRLRNVR